VNENLDTDQSRPASEPLIEEQRSATQVALQAIETIATGAEYGAGLYVGKEAIAPVAVRRAVADSGANDRYAKQRL
jgi:hypothetical protein